MSHENSGNRSLILAIVLVLAAMVGLMELLTSRLDTRLRGSARGLADLQLRQLHYAVEAFRAEVGRYPQDSEGLEALVRAPAADAVAWKGPYLQKAELPLDPWQHPYVYRRTEGGAFEVVSLGADGRPGGTDENEDLVSTNIVAKKN